MGRRQVRSQMSDITKSMKNTVSAQDFVLKKHLKKSKTIDLHKAHTFTLDNGEEIHLADFTKLIYKNEIISAYELTTLLNINNYRRFTNDK